MSTRDDIRAAAILGGWTIAHACDWFDEFLRDVTLDPQGKLWPLFAASGHQPRERLFVRYNGRSDRERLTEASYSGPGQQTALHGTFAGVEFDFYGKDKRGQIIAHLTKPVDIRPIV